MTRQPSWNEVIETLIESDRATLHTAMPGTIRSYSESTQTATVELAVKPKQPGGGFEALTPLTDVPVVWPGAWSDGDSCLCVFSEEDFSSWFADGTPAPPAVQDRHGYHALCIPLVARAGDAVQFVALANLVDQALETIRTTWIVNTAMGPSSTFAAAGMTALSTVAASKVKAR